MRPLYIIPLCALVLLAGCSTTIPVTKVEMPAPPAILMAVPLAATPLPSGSVDPKTALSTIVSNNTLDQQVRAQLGSLQKWITDTEANLKSSNQSKPVQKAQQILKKP